MPDHERFSLTFSYEPVENDWVQVRIDEFPEVVTAAPNRREARLAALDALTQYLASFGPGERVPTATAENPEVVA